jgi:hypothetical protein
MSGSATRRESRRTRIILAAAPGILAALVPTSFRKEYMSKNVTVTGTDKTQVVFLEKGEFSLRLGEGIPVVSTGNPKDKTAVVHGTVPGTTIVAHNPA